LSVFFFEHEIITIIYCSNEKRRQEDVIVPLPVSDLGMSGTKKAKLLPPIQQRISDDERSKTPPPTVAKEVLPSPTRTCASNTPDEDDSPSTSQVKVPEKPLSEFYQSLLESSLALDGKWRV
jgi:hypothetical protein